MTTQLWGWKCNGQDEFGYELSNRSHDGSRRFARIDSGTSGFMRDTRFITDLHKVKVVDAEVVVIDSRDVLGEFSYTHLRVIHVKQDVKQDELCQDGSHTFVNDTCKYCGEKLPILEPTGFGAIVEAGFKTFPESFRRRWVSTPTYQGTLIWNSEDCALQPWENLINPVVISKGQK